MTSPIRRVGKKLIGAALAGTLGFAGVAALVPGVADTAATVTTQRLAGTNRYGTAAAIAAATFPTGSNNIILASGENFPDGLAAATLAGAVGGPILLTAQASLPQETSNAIGSIDGGAAGAGTVWVVGGTAAISDNVRSQLKTLGYTGATLKEIAGATPVLDGGCGCRSSGGQAANAPFNGLRTAVVATGEAFPDALTAGSPAFVHKMPILLTTTAALSPEADTALSARAIQQVIVMGGTAAVSPAVRSAITAKGITIIEISGVDRFDTAAILAALLIKPAATGGFGFNSDTGTAGPQVVGAQIDANDPTNDAGVDDVVLAYGLNFPDALAAAPLAGTRLAPILLTASIPDKTKAALQSMKASADRVAGVGGTAVMPDADLTAAGTELTAAVPTATITANQGSRRFTVTYSENISGAAASTLANYRLNAAALPAGSAIVAPYSPASRSLTIEIPLGALPTGFAVGDTIAITNNSVCTVEATPRCVAATSKTVAADTTAPTATVKGFTPTVLAANGRVVVIFSEEVTTSNTNNTAGAFDAGDLSSNGGQVPNAGLTQLAPNAFIATFGTPLAAGNTITLSTAWADLAGNVPTGITTTTVVSDTGAPVLSSASQFTIPLAQGARTVPGQTVTVTAKVGTATDGSAGNAWSVSATDNNAAVAISVDATNKVVNIAADLDNSAGLQPTDLAVTNALSGSSAVTALFAISTGDASAFTGGATGNLAGGTDLLAVIVNYSEGMDSTSSTIADYALDSNGDGVAEVGPVGAAAVNTNAHNGVIIATFLNFDPAFKLTGGTSRIRVTGAQNDLAGNPLLIPTSVVIS